MADLDRRFADSTAWFEKGMEAVFESALDNLRRKWSRVPGCADAVCAEEIVAATSIAPPLSTPVASHVFPDPKHGPDLASSTSSTTSTVRPLRASRGGIATDGSHESEAAAPASSSSNLAPAAAATGISVSRAAAVAPTSGGVFFLVASAITSLTSPGGDTGAAPDANPLVSRGSIGMPELPESTLKCEADHVLETPVTCSTLGLYPVANANRVNKVPLPMTDVFLAASTRVESLPTVMSSFLDSTLSEFMTHVVRSADHGDATLAPAACSMLVRHLDVVDSRVAKVLCYQASIATVSPFECLQVWTLWSLEKSVKSGTTLAALETEKLHLLGDDSTSSGHNMVDYLGNTSLLWYLDVVLGGIEKWRSYTHSVQPTTINSEASVWQVCYVPGSSLQVNAKGLARHYFRWAILLEGGASGAEAMAKQHNDYVDDDDSVQNKNLSLIQHVISVCDISASSDFQFPCCELPELISALVYLPILSWDGKYMWMSTDQGQNNKCNLLGMSGCFLFIQSRISRSMISVHHILSPSNCSTNCSGDEDIMLYCPETWLEKQYQRIPWQYFWCKGIMCAKATHYGLAFSPWYIPWFLTD